MRDLRVENPKPRNQDSKLAVLQLFKFTNKVNQEKKKDCHSHSQDCQDKKAQKSSIPAIKVNTLKPNELKKKKKKRMEQDLNIVICYNYDKNGYYLTTCSKLSKN